MGKQVHGSGGRYRSPRETLEMNAGLQNSSGTTLRCEELQFANEFLQDERVGENPVRTAFCYAAL